jgi:hypothetical protein
MLRDDLRKEFDALLPGHATGAGASRRADRNAPAAAAATPAASASQAVRRAARITASPPPARPGWRCRTR